MTINIGKLELVKHRSNTIIARCPACYELGHDQKGEHLIVNPSGEFGCVVHQGDEGKAHRKRIFELVGKRHSSSKQFSVRERLVLKPLLLQKDVLIPVGRLGRDA